MPGTLGRISVSVMRRMDKANMRRNTASTYCALWIAPYQLGY